MSYTSMDIASKDQALINRVIACVQQQAIENPDLKGTDFAVTARSNPAEGIQLLWPVVVATEDAYAYALDVGVSNPGSNLGVIPDAAILAAVQAAWPQDAP